LRDNNWNESQPASVANGQLHEMKSAVGVSNVAQPPRAPLRITKPAVKVQASGGLKAFLASKRKMLDKAENENNKPIDVEPMAVAVSENEDTCSSTKEKLEESLIISNSEKLFDGGFYTISSPQPKSTLDSFRKRESMSTSIILEGSMSPFTRSSALRTPNRRNSQRLSTASGASLRRVSMCILGVRKSMGPLMKIGVTPIGSEDNDPNSSNMSIAENKIEEPEADEMQVD